MYGQVNEGMAGVFQPRFPLHNNNWKENDFQIKTFVYTTGIPLYRPNHNKSVFLGPPSYTCLNTLRPRQNGRHFPDNILKYIFLNENLWMSIQISLKFVPKGQIINIPALVQVMALRWPGAGHYLIQWWSSLPTHICVSRPQCVNSRCRCSRKGMPHADGNLMRYLGEGDPTSLR